MAINAFAVSQTTGPQFDLVGPTVDADIWRIIRRYGAAAVKDAVKRQTTAKRGRKPVKDWPDLRDVIEADARDWLAGGSPFDTRSNYSIAKDFADKNPGHSHPATMKRIFRKLAKNRQWMTLATAENLSREDYPHASHVRALEALAEVKADSLWTDAIKRAKSDIADYEAKMGEPPPPDLSMKAVENIARNALMRLSTEVKPGRKTGLLGAYLHANSGSK